MEKFDPKREEQVWHRVMRPSEPQREEIRPLLLQTWEGASVYRHLAALLSGKAREQAKLLERRAMDSTAALKGIRLLSGGQPGKLNPVPIPRESVRRLLEKSFFRSMQLMTEYTARGLDPEFGVVYQQLADRERENGMMLARLLGETEQ